jgi:hypothetical protein
MFFQGYGSHCAQADELTIHTMANAASARLADCANAAVMAIPLAGFYAGFWSRDGTTSSRLLKEVSNLKSEEVGTNK